jgi:hypothetical protein
MDEPPPLDRKTAATPPKPRRSGLIAPLPAVVVGLGLASGPAVAQSYVARPDAFTIPADATTFLPVIANDTYPNALPQAIVFNPPFPGGNAVGQPGGFLFTPPPGFDGQIRFSYCIQGAPFACANVVVEVHAPGVPIPAVSGAALAGLSGVLGWLGLRLRRRE